MWARLKPPDGGGIRHGLDTLREDVVDLGKVAFGPITAATAAVDVTVV